MRNCLLALSMFFVFPACSPKPKTVKEASAVESSITSEMKEEREVREIKHSSPEPSKLDSIKQAKKKLKTQK